MAEILLTQGRVAVVDDEDVAWITRHRWHFDKKGGYAVRNAWRPIEHRYFGLPMHRAILDAPAGMDVDHRNGNRLDNRRENLRLCTRQQNHWNRTRTRGVSQFKGVYRTRSGKWAAEIRVSGLKTHLGCYSDEVAAAHAYDAAARKHFGEFAFPDFRPTVHDVARYEAQAEARDAEQAGDG